MIDAQTVARHLFYTTGMKTNILYHFVKAAHIFKRCFGSQNTSPGYATGQGVLNNFPVTV